MIMKAFTTKAIPKAIDPCLSLFFSFFLFELFQNLQAMIKAVKTSKKVSRAVARTAELLIFIEAVNKAALKSSEVIKLARATASEAFLHLSFSRICSIVSGLSSSFSCSIKEKHGDLPETLSLCPGLISALKRAASRGELGVESKTLELATFGKCLCGSPLCWSLESLASIPELLCQLPWKRQLGLLNIAGHQFGDCKTAGAFQ